MTQPSSGVFLETARLGERNPVLLQYEEMVHFPRMRRRYDAFVRVDIAHVVMLIERGILNGDAAARLLRGLVEIHAMGSDGFPWLPNSGSFLVQVENVLGDLVGQDAAGLLQTARSRNDQAAAGERLYQRDLLLVQYGELVNLVDTIINVAERHVDTLMPGYTHLQHAQPWTFGHYLMRQAAVMERNLQRLRGAFERTNLSSLGGAANAGTSWPIDRRRVAALLGHSDIVFNSIDACGFAREFVEENTACLALVMSNLGRFATDFYVWSSWEFGLLEVSDSLAGTSSIMPQKKNPHSLERVKAIAGQAAGWLPTVMSNMRGVLSTDLDYSYGEDYFGIYSEATFGALKLMTESVATVIVHDKRMAETAGVFWSTTSHLADELVRRYDLTFRVAHQIVARFVKVAIEAGHRPDTVRAADLIDAGLKEANLRIDIDDEGIRQVLDARHFVETRISEGGVHPDQTRRHVADLRKVMVAHRTWHDKQDKAIKDAISGMIAVATSLANAKG